MNFSPCNLQLFPFLSFILLIISFWNPFFKHRIPTNQKSTESTRVRSSFPSSTFILLCFLLPPQRLDFSSVVFLCFPRTGRGAFYLNKDTTAVLFIKSWLSFPLLRFSNVTFNCAGCHFPSVSLKIDRLAPSSADMSRHPKDTRYRCLGVHLVQREEYVTNDVKSH